MNISKSQTATEQPESPAKVFAPGVPEFELHSLGWRAFQDLCGVVLREVLNQSFQIFADTNDAGRDGAFYGEWSPQANARFGIATLSGPTVLQCKFSARRDSTLTLSTMVDEMDKVAALVDRGLCVNYIVATNSRVTGHSEEKIRDAMLRAGARSFVIIDGGWLCHAIAQSQPLRAYVPRIYGLGDLSQILDVRAYDQARTLLSYLRNDLLTFVPTDAYSRAVEALQNHGFVILLGEPAAGKSVIASALALSATDRWGCLPIKVDSASELVQHWNPHESQFFWVDDAFGAVRHERQLSNDWSRRLPKVLAAVQNGARVVMTSRDYIYRQARVLLKESSFPALVENRVVVDVARLTLEEREQILYNHVRMGDQPAENRRRLKQYLPAAAASEAFRPEIARRLGQKSFTANLFYSRTEVVRFMSQPKSFLAEVYSQLERHHIAALALVYLTDGLASPLSLDDAQRGVINKIGSSLPDTSESLAHLEEGILRFGPVLKENWSGDMWQFQHPTLKEGFASYIASQPHLLDVYIAGLSDEQLLRQIDCNEDAPRQGTLVRVSSPFYDSILARIATMSASASWESKERIHDFLANRCSKLFLSRTLAQLPELVERAARFGSYMSVSSKPALLAKLSSFGLLPESTGEGVVALVRELAVETPDADWLDSPDFAILLTSDERVSILDDVRSALLNDMESFWYNWESNEQGDDIRDYYEPLESAIGRYLLEFKSDPDLKGATEELLRRVSSRLDNLSDDGEDDSAGPYTFARRSAVVQSDPGRSIFDDVDA